MIVCFSSCRPISFYLAFRYPERYFTYKYTEAKKVAEWTQADPISMTWDPAEKYHWYLNMAKKIRTYLLAQDEFKSTYVEWLKTNELVDPEFTFLTADFIIQTADWREGCRVVLRTRTHDAATIANQGGHADWAEERDRAGSGRQC